MGQISSHHPRGSPARPSVEGKTARQAVPGKAAKVGRWEPENSRQPKRGHRKTGLFMYE